MLSRLMILSLMSVSITASLSVPVYGESSSQLNQKIAFSLAQGSTSDADKLFERGVKLFGQGLYFQAIPVYQRVLEIRRQQGNQAEVARILNNIGEVYLKLDENEKANQFAHYLKSVGVEAETKVGICLERSEKMLVGLLGILKAGGTYIPLDPAFPEERLRFMVEDSGVDFLVMDSGETFYKTSLHDNSIILINVDNDWESIEKQSSENLPSQTTLENLAYVIYTSGSTGKPKGVQILHSALVNCLESMQKKPGITSNDILLSVTTLSFDIAGLELYLPLITGSRLIIASRETATDARLLKQSLADNQVTIMQATPATWRLLLTSGWEGNQQLKILCGGEALDTNIAEELLERCKEVWNLYGPTEATIWSSVAKCREVIHNVSSNIPIGKPLHPF